MRSAYLIGVDEVGRGPLAGPVTVCAFLIKKENKNKVMSLLQGIRESKSLSKSQREEWILKMKKLRRDGLVNWSVRSSSSIYIDKHGIVSAIKKCIRLVLNDLDVNPENTEVLLDGSLYAPKSYKRQTTIIGGDKKIKLIAMASVAAKVHRDRRMTREAIRFPQYGFDINSGYGTKNHIKAIKKHGASVIHRFSYIRGIVNTS
jgi:ribonuclease HII